MRGLARYSAGKVCIKATYDLREQSRPRQSGGTSVRRAASPSPRAYLDATSEPWREKRP